MSSDGDVAMFESALNDNLAESQTVLFNDKNYTFIVDSTSNSGTFSNQIQFNLQNFNSSSQYIDLKEAIIEFPIKIVAKVTALPGSGSPSVVGNLNSVIIKNGFHQFINGVQVQINGTQLQSLNDYENVAISYRMLSEWSQDTATKWGKSVGFALDDCSNTETSTTLSTTAGLANVPLTSGTAGVAVTTLVKGLDIVGNQALIFNKGVQTRAALTNNSITESTLQSGILKNSGMKQSGVSHCAVATASTVGTVNYCCFGMGRARLGDMCDLSQFPPTKQLSGFIYISYNSATTTISPDTTNLFTNGSVSTQINSGRTNPVLINTNPTTGGFNASALAGITYTVTAGIDGTATDAIGNASPIITQARLLAPFYVANPKVDLKLSNSRKFFTVRDKIVQVVECPANSSITPSLTSGLPNVKQLVMLPMLKKLGGPNTFDNAETSPFDSCPATSSPFAALTQVNVMVGNKALFQTPISYDYEMWATQCAQTNAMNGAFVDGSTSGLLSETLWSQNHRYHAFDLSRRMDSDDGISKSVQVQFTNPTSYAVRVICMVFYEKQYYIDTNTCMISPV